MKNMPIPLSVLDQSPVVPGATPGDAIRATIELARVAEALGYHRFWLAEHHSMGVLADPSPEILLARITGETSRIRIGTGGVLLPHYRALKVAEQFRALEALAPGRIDLGIGRAPGGMQLVSKALGSFDVSEFPQQVNDLVNFLDGTIPTDHRFAKLRAMPDGCTAPDVWLLGSSDYSAMLAAEMGLPFAFAHFISGNAPEVTRMYRRNFRPSSRSAVPRVLLAMSALVGDTPEAAETFGKFNDFVRLRIRHGIDKPPASLQEALEYQYTFDERAEVAFIRYRTMIGTAGTVRRQIEDVTTLHHADEAMIVSILPDYKSRLRSYELLAQAFALPEALAS